MISMTGYASGDFSINELTFFIEIKSYNHRFLDISLKLPRFLIPLEVSLKKEISKVARRGKVDIYIAVQGIPVSSLIDKKRFKETYLTLKKLSEELGMGGKIGIDSVFLLKEAFISSVEKMPLSSDLEKVFFKHFKKIMNQFFKSKVKEGENLKKDIKSRFNFVEKTMKKINKLLPELKNKQKDKILRKLNEIFKNDIEKNRLEQELVFYLDKMDVTEEVVRFDSHAKNFKKVLAQDEPIGKKLDFYIQEMIREINTLSVKTQDSKISELVVELKTEIEKIREQIQNVE